VILLVAAVLPAKTQISKISLASLRAKNVHGAQLVKVTL
jgi:hypothetical protein